MQECGADLQAVGYLAHPVIEDRVARDPEDAMLLPLPLEREPDHLTDDRVAQRRAMTTRRSRDLDRRPAGRLQSRTGPWLESASLTSEATGARDGRDDRSGRSKQGSARGVQVVGVVIMGEQHRVDRPDVGGGYRRP